LASQHVRDKALNRLELSRLEPTHYHKISHNPIAIKRLMVDLFLDLPGAGRSARSGHPGRGRRLGMAELLFRIYVTSWKSCDSYFAWRSH
jgi:hypothetical protein